MTLDDYKARVYACSSILTLLEVSNDRISEEESDKITMELARFMYEISSELCGDLDMDTENRAATLDERLDKMHGLLSEIKWLNSSTPVVPEEIIEPRIASLFTQIQTLLSETKEWYAKQRSAQ